MAGEIASVVLEIARFIYEVYQANLELEEQEREMARSCTVLTAAVKGLTHAENFTPALEQMRDALMSAKRTVNFLMQRRAGGKKWHVKPQVQLDELARHSATLQRVAGELTLALTAHLVRSADQAAADDVKFDNLRVLAHSSAKKFWQRNAGPYARDMKTRTFLQAFRHEYGQNSAVMTDQNLELLKRQVDSSDDGAVSIYELARFTDKLGLLRSFIELVESVTRKPPPSTGTYAEILRRSILVEGAYLSDFQSSTPLRDAIEATCTIIKYARVEPIGVLIEMIEDDIADSIARMEIPEAVRHRRLQFRAVTTGTQTVDQILDAAAKAREEQEVKAQATSEAKETAGSDKLALEVKLLEEEHEMKQEVSNNSHRSALVQLEVKYQSDLKACRADSKLTAATRPRAEAELRKKYEADKAKAAEAWRSQASALRKQEDEAREAALSRSPFKKGLMDLLGTSPKKIAAEFHGRFPQAPPDEDPADRWYAVEDAGMSVGRYGYLYCTQAGLYFWSGSLTGTQFRREVSFQQLFVVEKTSYVWFPTALTITFRVEGAHTKEVQFRDFSDRESAFKVIEQQWKNYAEQMLKGKIQSAKTKSWYVPSSGLTVHHEGFLDKKGDVIKNYKRRWFTLTSRGLAYAVAKDQPTIKQISIITVADVRVDEKGTTAEKYPFHVLTEKRTWHMVASSTRERVEWVAKIKEVVAAQRFSFFYGLITNDPPAHVVMEFRFAERALNIMMGGVVKSTIPFSSIQSVEADVQSLGFTILRADKDSRHALCAQSAEERDELVATLNHLVEEMRLTAESKLGLEGDIVEDKGDESVGLLDFSGVQIALTRLQSTALHLLKKGAVEIVGQGKTRYLYLEQIGSLARLLIYQSDTAIAPLEVINLPRTAVCKSIVDNKNMLLHAMGRPTMTLRFPTQPIRDEWFTCIAVVMRAINAGLTAQVPSSSNGGISVGLVSSPTMANLNFSGEKMSPLSDGDGQSSRPPLGRGASMEPMLGSMLSPRSPQVPSTPSSSAVSSPSSPISSTPVGPHPLEAEVKQLQSQLTDMKNKTADLSRQVTESEGRVRDTQRIAADTERAYRDMESQLKMSAAERRSDAQRMNMLWLRQGALMMKYSKGKGNERYIVYRDSFPDAVGPIIGWAESKKNADKNKMHYIPVNEIKDVRPGFGTTQFGVQKGDKESLSFSILADLRSLDLMTDNVQARDFWVASIREAVGLGPLSPTEMITGSSSSSSATAAPSTPSQRR